jgi:hypothetical protein
MFNLINTKAWAPIALLLTATALLSQNTQTPKITVSTHLVQIGVIVRDHNGSVENLTKDDFVVLDRGKPQKISIFEIEGAESTTPPASELPQTRSPIFRNMKLTNREASRSCSSTT